MILAPKKIKSVTVPIGSPSIWQEMMGPDWLVVCGCSFSLRYADDTTLMAESEEELKSLLMKLKKESEKRLEAQHLEN